MMLNKYYTIYFVLVAFCFNACSSVLKDTETCKQATQLPEKFIDFKDSSNIAEINWHSYFTDSVLVGLIDSAVKNNFDLLAAIQHIEMARANVRSAKGELFPSISATAGAGIQRYGLYTMNGAGNDGTVIYNNELIPEKLQDYNLGLQASWELDLWGQLRNKKRSAVASFLASIEGKNLVLTELISDIADNYYDLLALDNKLDIIKESLKLQDSALNIVKVQKQAAMANELAVQQFEAEVLNSKELEVETLQKISECENNLNFLMGKYPQFIQRDKNVLAKLIPGEMKTGVPSDLLKNRPDIRKAEFELIAAKSDVKSARAAFFPSVNITGTYGYDAFKTSLLFSPQSLTYSAIGSLIAPLVNRSAIKAEFKTAKAAQLEALYNYQKSILNGYTEVYNQLVNYNSNVKLLEMKSKEVDILNSAMNSCINLFKTGRATYLEVLTTQQNILQSKIELVDAQKEQCQSIIGIYIALGGGWR